MPSVPSKTRNGLAALRVWAAGTGLFEAFLLGAAASWLGPATLATRGQALGMLRVGDGDSWWLLLFLALGALSPQFIPGAWRHAVTGAAASLAMLWTAGMSDAEASGALGLVPLVVGAWAFASTSAFLALDCRHPPSALAAAALGATAAGALGFAVAGALAAGLLATAGAGLLAAVAPRRSPEPESGPKAALSGLSVLCGAILAVQWDLNRNLAVDATTAWFPGGAAWFGLVTVAVASLGNKARPRAGAVALVGIAAAACLGEAFDGCRTDAACAAWATVVACALGGAAGLALPRGGREVRMAALTRFLFGWLGAQALLQISLPASTLVCAATLATALWLLRRTLSGWAAATACCAALLASLADDAEWARPVPGAQPRTLRARGCAELAYLPRTQELVVRDGRLEVDRLGPGRPQAALLAAFAVLFRSSVEPVVVCGAAPLPAAAALQECGLSAVERIDCGGDAGALGVRLDQVGPLPPTPRAGATQAAMTSQGLAPLQWAAAGPAKVGAFVVADGAAPAALGLEGRGAEVLAAALGPAVLIHRELLDVVEPDELAARLDALAAANPWCGAFLFDRTLIVLAADAPPDFRVAAERLEALPASVRWRLHEAGLCGPEDLAWAFLGCLRQGSHGVCSRRSLAASLETLARRTSSSRVQRWAAALAEPSDPEIEALVLAGLDEEIERRPMGVLARRQAMTIAMRQFERALVAADPQDEAQVADLAHRAARYCHLGCPTPALQAALALPDRRGESLRRASHAGTLALALDPGWAQSAPPVLRDVVGGLPPHGPFLDMATMPDDARLCELCVGDSALAVALRSRFPSRCARALVLRWRLQPLPVPALSALRELADPFVLQQAAACLQEREGGGELLAAWRADLPMLPCIESLWQRAPSARSALLTALAGRRDEGSLRVLQLGMLEEDSAVRLAAAAALFRSIGGGIVYDPAWPLERRRSAASQLRAQSQRTSR